MRIRETLSAALSNCMMELEGHRAVCLKLSVYPRKLPSLPMQPSNTWVRTASHAHSILSVCYIAKCHELWQTADLWLTLWNPLGKSQAVLKKKQSNNLKMLRLSPTVPCFRVFLGYRMLKRIPKSQAHSDLYDLLSYLTGTQRELGVQVLGVFRGA